MSERIKKVPYTFWLEQEADRMRHLCGEYYAHYIGYRVEAIIPWERLTPTQRAMWVRNARMARDRRYKE